MDSYRSAVKLTKLFEYLFNILRLVQPYNLFCPRYFNAKNNICLSQVLHVKTSAKKELSSINNIQICTKNKHIIHILTNDYTTTHIDF